MAFSSARTVSGSPELDRDSARTISIPTFISTCSGMSPVFKLSTWSVCECSPGCSTSSESTWTRGTVMLEYAQSTRNWRCGRADKEHGSESSQSHPAYTTQQQLNIRKRQVLTSMVHRSLAGELIWNRIFSVSSSLRLHAFGVTLTRVNCIVWYGLLRRIHDRSCGTQYLEKYSGELISVLVRSVQLEVYVGYTSYTCTGI